MRVSSIWLMLIAVSVAVLGGCREKTPNLAPLPVKPVFESVARIHWVGKTRLVSDTNASALVAIWNLPEGRALEDQTLDKLAAAVLGFGGTNGNAPLVRALFDDLVQAEWFVEMRHSSNMPSEISFSIKLDSERAGVWESSMSPILQSLGTFQPVPGMTNAWLLSKPHLGEILQTARTGNWTTLELISSNSLLADPLRSGHGQVGSPPTVTTSNSWLEVFCDAKRVADALGFGGRVPKDFPVLSMSATGDSENVITRASLDFPQPIKANIEPWNVPTNLIHDPLVSFTGLRSVDSLLESAGLWDKAKFGEAPNQVFFWSLDGSPLLSFVAAPFCDATNAAKKITDTVLLPLNLRIDTNRVGGFIQNTNQNGATWSGIPLATPFLSALTQDFVVGGLLQYTPTDRPIPAELLQSLYSQTNVLMYDWESTDIKVRDWLYTGQFLRVLMGKKQMAESSRGLDWLRAASTNLRNCNTVVRVNGPQQISFVRRSTLGFSSLELHLLVDFLESARFPFAINSWESAAKGQGAPSTNRMRERVP